MAKTILAMSKVKFDRTMNEMHMDDSNAEDFYPLHVISVCQSYIDHGFAMGENMVPHFKADHANVLNLRFDDVVCDVPVWDAATGGTIVSKAMTEEQADDVRTFIDRIPPNGTLLVHCHMGQRRSGAIAKYAANRLGYSEIELMQRNPQIDPNPHVMRLLNSGPKFSGSDPGS